MNTLQSALHWLSLGIAPLPARYRDKRPKLPTWAEFQERLPTEEEVATWFEHQFCNLALITGWQGLTVLDFDNLAAFELWQTWAAQHTPLVAELTYKVATARGIHVYVALEDAPPGTMKLGLVDVKAAGGYVLAPPSVHPSGRRYQAIDPAAPIIHVQSLASVLPAELLVLDAAPPATITLGTELSSDPWDAALNPAKVPDGESQIATILAQHNLFEMFPNAVKRGQRFWTACPLHGDTNPSLAIDSDGRRARCWAGCTPERGFDYIDFYAAMHNMTNTQAIQVLS